jgi:hypothetical protein
MDARLTRYVVDEDGCWIWTGARTGQGYGAIQRTYGSNLVDAVHRRAYEERYGPIPAGLVIDHLCRKPPCINPEHLEAVTVAVNTRRGRAAKLTVDDVREIRRSSARGVDMAARFGVSKATISEVRSGKYWRNLEEGEGRGDGNRRAGRAAS